MKVLVAGDYAYGGRQKDILHEHKYDALFGNIKNIINSVDIAIVNYENPVLLEGNDNWEICGPQNMEGGLKARSKEFHSKE